MTDKPLGPFDIVNSLSKGDRTIIDHPEFFKAYIPFVINRHLSYFTDTILLSNIMNESANLDKDLQFEFYINTVKPRSRYSKWAKSETLQDLNLIKKCFNYSDAKAREALKILSKEEIEAIRQDYEEVV